MGFLDDVIEKKAPPAKQEGFLDDVLSQKQETTPPPSQPQNQENPFGRYIDRDYRLNQIKRRTDLGLPLRGNKHIEIREPEKVSSLQAFYEGTAMGYGVKASDQALVEHPVATAIGEAIGQIPSIIPIGRGITGTATTAQKVASGTLSGMTWNGLQGFLQAGSEGQPWEKVANETIKSGIVGGIFGGTFSLAASKLVPAITNYKSWAVDVLKVKQEIFAGLDKFNAETQNATKEAHETWKDIQKILPDKASNERVIHAYEHISDKPELTEKLTETEKSALQLYKTTMEPITQLMKDHGLSKEFQENYIKHLWTGTSLKELNRIMTDMPGDKKRSFSTMSEGVEFLKRARDEVKTLLGVDPKSIVKMTNRELVDLINRLPQDLHEDSALKGLSATGGGANKLRRWMSMEPVYDLGLSAGATIKAARQTLATRDLLHTMATIQDEEGRFLFDDVGRGDPAYVTPRLPGGMMEKYFYLGSKDVGEVERLLMLSKGKISVLKEYAPLVERLLDNHSNPSTTMQAIHELARITKAFTFYNPLWHMVNLASEQLKVSPFAPWKALGIGSRAILNDSERMSAMLRSGVNDAEIYRMNKEMSEALGKASGAYRMGILSDFADVMRHYQDKSLWHYARSLQANIWEAERAALIRQGIAVPEAEKMAAIRTNDATGHVADHYLPEMLKSNEFARMAVWIPQWVTTKLREFTGAVAPGFTFPSLPAAQRSVMQRRYALGLASATMQFVMYNSLMNKALSGHWPWQNDTKNQYNVAGSNIYLPKFEKIETRWTDRHGNKITVDNPFFKGLTLPLRILQHPQFFENPLAREVSGQAKGETPWGKPYTDAGMTLKQKTLAHVQHFFEDAPIIGPLATYALEPKKDALQLIPMLLPTYISKVSGGGPGIGKMLDMWRTDNPIEYKAVDIPWKLDIDAALEKNDMKQVYQIMQEHPIPRPSEFLKHRMMKVNMPINYALSIMGKRWLLYLSKLSDSERKQVLEARSREVTNTRSKSNPENPSGSGYGPQGTTTP